MENNKDNLKNQEQTHEEFLKDFLEVPGKKKTRDKKTIKEMILEQYNEEIP